MGAGHRSRTCDTLIIQALGLNRQNTILFGLEYCTNMTGLSLWGNQISGISPLVANSGLDEGDVVSLEGNKLELSEGSKALEDIRQLEARGVQVLY